MPAGPMSLAVSSMPPRRCWRRENPGRRRNLARPAPMRSSTYRGSCHCDRVTFEARAELSYVVDCNCSICRRVGALWHPAAEADPRILTGEAELVLDQFNTKTAKHYFGRRCRL